MPSTHSVLAFFKNIRDAQKALNELYSADFPAQQIRLVANELDENLDNNRTDSTWSRTSPDRKGGMQKFLSDLFGRPEEEDLARFHTGASLQEKDDRGEMHDSFHEQYRQGRHIVLVMAVPRLAAAADILRAAGGEVDEQANKHFEEELLRRPPSEHTPVPPSRRNQEAENRPTGPRPYL